MLPDFQYVLAHPDILTELPGIRGLLRKRYPSLQNGLFYSGKKMLSKSTKKLFYCRFINIRFSEYGKTLQKRY